MVEGGGAMAKRRREPFIRASVTDALLQAPEKAHTISQPRMRGAREAQARSQKQSSPRFGCLRRPRHLLDSRLCGSRAHDVAGVAVRQVRGAASSPTQVAYRCSRNMQWMTQGIDYNKRFVG